MWLAICSRLDGMPLAIELAAARTKLLAPHAILSRLDRSLELGGIELERPTRQRTLRQTIAWSFDLLTRDQQRFFSQLGVFGGSCDLEARGGRHRIGLRIRWTRSPNWPM